MLVHHSLYQIRSILSPAQQVHRPCHRWLIPDAYLCPSERYGDCSVALCMSREYEIGCARSSKSVQRIAQVWHRRHSPVRQAPPTIAITVAALSATATAFASRAAADCPPAPAHCLQTVQTADLAASPEVDSESTVGTVAPRQEWYRGSLALAYGVPVTMLTIGYAAQSADVATVGALGLLAAPIVHVGHGNLGRGLLSVGGMLGTGILGLFVGAVVAHPRMCFGSWSDDPDDEFESDCEPSDGGAVVGLLAGVSTWAVIDVAFLAYEDVPAEPGASFAPWVSPVVRHDPHLGSDGGGDAITGMQVGALGRF